MNQHVPNELDKGKIKKRKKNHLPKGGVEKK